LHWTQIRRYENEISDFNFNYFTKFCFCWILETFYPVGATNAKTVYRDKSSCESAESGRPGFGGCFSISKKDMRRYKKGFRAIDILKTRDCLNSADCQSQIDNLNFSCPQEVATFDDKANWPGLDFAAESRPATGFFLWCQKAALVIDSAKSAAADAEDAKKAADKVTRANKKAAFDTKLKQCVKVGLKGVSDLNPGTATTAQLANRQNKLIACFVSLLKDYAAPRLKPADL